MEHVDNLVVIQLADPVHPGDARRLAETLVANHEDIMSATPAHGDGFGHVIYNLEQMAR